MGLEDHAEITGGILKCAFEVQNTLGCGFLEKIYENALVVALKEDGFQVAQQVPLRVHFKEVLVGEYIADIIVNRTVLVENQGNRAKSADLYCPDTELFEGNKSSCRSSLEFWYTKAVLSPIDIEKLSYVAAMQNTELV